MSYPDITISNRHERRLLKGHLWAFSNELKEIRKDIPPGSIVRLLREFDEKPFALAFYHPNSLIAARIITRDSAKEIGEAFFRSRIERAAARRAFILSERSGVRLIHGESDFLPGLILEKYNDILTFQITSAGMELQKDVVVSLLKDIFSPKSIIEKNKSHLRKLEGLPELESVVFGTETETEIHDGAGIKFAVSLLKGQKTGFYLDQMENRTAFARYVKQNDSVLDLFSNEGGFALNMAAKGAKVIAVDASADALENAKKNANLNGLGERVQTVTADCFDYLRDSSEKFDAVVLDPPSLLRSKKELHGAKKAYFNLHKNAMKCTKPEGFLATASCSHHLTRDLFLEIIRDAAGDAGRAVTILEERGAGADHPVLAMMPETEYLKMFILRVH
ncbi:MAG: class I SAM-dependent rRNA methyltransferase [Bacteroidota bacterium]|nr:class I SAM-dependent rRNA methyltransferase [Bacteroidota bacterium]